jgi:hypothetical protein
MELKPECGFRFLIEGEDEKYENIDELLARYVESTNEYINKLINHPKFQPNEGQLSQFLQVYHQNHPQYIAFGFYMNNEYPGSFVCGYELRPGSQMLKMVCIIGI